MHITSHILAYICISMVRFSLHWSLVLPGIKISVGSFSGFEGFEVFLASEFTCCKETSVGFDRLGSSDFAFIVPKVSKLEVELRKVFDFCVEAVSLSGFGFEKASSTGSCFEAVTISEVCPEVGTLSEMFETISLFEFSFFGSSLILGVMHLA